jgi:4-carboxymuconolactone decarboxylase
VESKAITTSKATACRNTSITYSQKVMNRIITIFSLALAALLLLPLVTLAQGQQMPTTIPPPIVQSQPVDQSRRERGDQVINKLSGGAGQPVLNALCQDFPFVANAIVDYSLGEVWSRQGLDDRTRQLATVAAFAAQGNLPQLKIHAGYALRLGATQDELKEIGYFTTVTAGFPRSIDAAQALRDIFSTSPPSPSTAQ